MKDAGQEIAPERSRAVGTVVIGPVRHGCAAISLRHSRAQYPLIPPCSSVSRRASTNPFFTRYRRASSVFVVADIPSPEDRRDWET